jgi:hypothetical protein
MNIETEYLQCKCSDWPRTLNGWLMPLETRDSAPASLDISILSPILSSEVVAWFLIT